MSVFCVIGLLSRRRHSESTREGLLWILLGSLSRMRLESSRLDYFDLDICKIGCLLLFFHLVVALVGANIIILHFLISFQLLLGAQICNFLALFGQLART